MTVVTGLMNCARGQLHTTSKGFDCVSIISCTRVVRALARLCLRIYVCTYVYCSRLLLLQRIMSRVCIRRRRRLYGVLAANYICNVRLPVVAVYCTATYPLFGLHGPYDSDRKSSPTSFMYTRL